MTDQIVVRRIAFVTPDISFTDFLMRRLGKPFIKHTNAYGETSLWLPLKRRKGFIHRFKPLNQRAREVLCISEHPSGFIVIRVLLEKLVPIVKEAAKQYDYDFDQKKAASGNDFDEVHGKINWSIQYHCYSGKEKYQ